MQFELVAPAPPTVTETADPQGGKHGGGRRGNGNNGQSRPGQRAPRLSPCLSRCQGRTAAVRSWPAARRPCCSLTLAGGAASAAPPCHSRLLHEPLRHLVGSAPRARSRTRRVWGLADARRTAPDSGPGGPRVDRSGASVPRCAASRPGARPTRAGRTWPRPRAAVRPTGRHTRDPAHPHPERCRRAGSRPSPRRTVDRPGTAARASGREVSASRARRALDVLAGAGRWTLPIASWKICTRADAGRNAQPQIQVVVVHRGRK